jgi:hypothetical protein
MNLDNDCRREILRKVNWKLRNLFNLQKDNIIEEAWNNVETYIFSPVLISVWFSVKTWGWNEIVIRHHPAMFDKGTIEKEIAKVQFPKYKLIYERLKKSGELDEK